MSKEIYISTTPHETRLAIVEDEQLAEIYFERENEYTLAGSIYNGKVTRVLPGMQSSFVDLGLERDAFLYVTDFMEEQGDAADFETDSRRPPRDAAREGTREAGVREGSREAVGREGVRDAVGRESDPRRGRGDRDRDRGRGRERPAPAEPAGETESFDEPIAPHPSEVSGVVAQDNVAALDEQGSRRWRGRRGRRRGRSTREAGSSPEAVSGSPAEQAEPEFLAQSEDSETIVLEGSSVLENTSDDESTSGLGDEIVSIEIDLASEPPAPESADYGYSRRIRENRREERARERGLTASPVRIERDQARGADATDRPEGLSRENAVASSLTALPFVLPGESIRKYRNPAEVQAEEAARLTQTSTAPALAAPAAPSIQVVGWDGGAVLPGETLSRYRRRESPAVSAATGSKTNAGTAEPVRSVERSNSIGQTAAPASVELGGAALPSAPRSSHEETLQDAPQSSDLGPSDAAEEDLTAPTPIPDVEAIPAAAAPDETGGLTQHPAHADASAAVLPVMVPLDAGTKTGATGEVAPVQESAEYEPVEGDRASLGESGRRDLRQRAPRPEPPVAGVQPETMAGAPDATVYDLSSSAAHISMDAPSMVETAVADAAQQGSTHFNPTLTEPEHEVTSLQASGDMVSELPSIEGKTEPELPPAQDAEHAPAQMDTEAAIQDGSNWTELNDPTELNDSTVLNNFTELNDEKLETTPVYDASATDAPADVEGALLAGMHAYGDGDLQEEEVDGDEFEYDLALTALEEDEFDDYEEETLEGTADLGSMLQETRPGQTARRAADEDDADDSAADDSAAAEATGGFTVADFGGEPEDELEDAPASSQGTDSRGRREPRRGSRDRDRRSGGGGFRGGAGGDRGRGRNGRPSVQAQDLPAINDLLKPGQEVLVQIAKEPIAKKGARITSHIALPGRFLVFMPTVNHTGVSRKISSDEERRRLKSILLSEKGDAQGGFIVRTAADGASEEELRNDLRFLIQLWQDIKARSESSKSPALIYHDLSLVERILRDQVTDNFSAIWVDTESEYERVLRFLQRFQPSLVRRVKLYTKETPIFEHFGVTQEIDRALKSKVWLKSGGSIVINQTEALVAIDINTGKYVGKTARLEDTILKTNLDAIPEIVRQIRLRDLGGIIVIDFIDMDERKNRAKVMQVLEDELRADRAPSKVLPFNDFGLVIMTRKRVKQSLERTLCIPDPITEGTGMIKSPITVANEIFVEMRKMHRHLERNDIMLRVHPEVVKQLKAAGGKRLQELEEMTRKTILVKSDPALNPEQFDIH